jgi:anti-anti-sigma regulatory factor
VLKITTTRESPETLRVYLCGELTGEYVPELQKALAPENTVGKIALDMSNVTFVDREAMMFLCSARSRVSIENILPYVIKWIELEFRCGSTHPKSEE